jgi:hypothetical protein
MEKKCPVWLAWLTLVVGIVFLLADLIEGWAFWGIQWWSAAFILIGLAKVLK